MCGISGADDIDCMDAADLLLTYALKIPLCSWALDASLDRTLPKIDNAARERHISLDLISARWVAEDVLRPRDREGGERR